MWKPVVVIVGENLLLSAAVSMHPPDLHGPGTLRIEIDVLPVRRIFWPVIEALRGRQPSFLPARRRNRKNIEVAISLAHKRQHLSVRRPAVPVRRATLRHSARSSAGNRKKINQ